MSNSESGPSYFEGILVVETTEVVCPRIQERFRLMEPEQGEWCEGCQQVRWSAIRRPDFDRVLCSGCNLEALRRNPPTGLVRRPIWAVWEETR